MFSRIAVRSLVKPRAQLLSRGCGHLFLLLLSGIDQKSLAFLEGSLCPDSEMQVSSVLVGVALGAARHACFLHTVLSIEECFISFCSVKEECTVCRSLGAVA